MSPQTAPYQAPSAEAAFIEMPKCNLHSHLEGSIRPETFWELAFDQGIDPGIARSQVSVALQVDGSERSLVDYLAKISITYQVLKNAKALERTAFEAAEDAAQDGVRYFELRAGPLTHTTPHLPVHDVIDSILIGLAAAEARYDIVCRLIVSALRDHNPMANVNLAHTALDFIDHGVVGFDLAGDEAGYPAQLHEDAFKVARQGGLGITVHAGEAGGPENVEYAVERLRASRIGHGIRSIESKDTLNMLRQNEILLEICPTSNVHTRTVRSIVEHPITDLYRNDIPISVGDDDPTTSRTRASQELTLLNKSFGFTAEQLQEIQENSLRYVFLTERSALDRMRSLF